MPEIILPERTEPATPTTNETTLYVDIADSHLKIKDDQGNVIDITDTASVVLATQQENFDKNTTKAISPNILANDERLQNYTIKNTTGTISQLLSIGSAYKVNSTLLASNETRNGLIFQLKDKNDTNQATYTVDNDKFLFPSNLYTLNNAYKFYTFRIITTLDHPAVGSNQSATLNIRLRREIDDSIVSSKEWTFANKSSRTGFKFTTSFDTFVGGETDPYILDGMYIDIENSSDSDTTVTLTEVDVRLFAL